MAMVATDAGCLPPQQPSSVYPSLSSSSPALPAPQASSAPSISIISSSNGFPNPNNNNSTSNSLIHPPYSSSLPLLPDFPHKIPTSIIPPCETSCFVPSIIDPPSCPPRPSLWYEEEIHESLRWCFGLTSILHAGVSKYQEIALLDTQVFGKVLTLDRKMQSAEKDEWVYHECLVHPALLCHPSPKSVFIMGGGEGSTAREALRHKSIKKVVMCDIDEEVVKFCSTYLTTNKEAFRNPHLELVINDAKAELECRDEKFDVIVGDLADPLEWGPCYQLYSKGFYQNAVKPKLNIGGIFVTQAGPAGILSHKEVFTSIYNTLKHVFTYVVAYSAHVPSYADTWGWVMASDQPLNQLVVTNEMDARIKQRILGELRYLDGSTLYASTILNKTVRHSLKNETHVYTEDSARFIYGHGRSTNGH